MQNIPTQEALDRLRQLGGLSAECLDVDPGAGRGPSRTGREEATSNPAAAGPSRVDVNDLTLTSTDDGASRACSETALHISVNVVEPDMRRQSPDGDSPVHSRSLASLTDRAANPLTAVPR